MLRSITRSLSETATQPIINAVIAGATNLITGALTGNVPSGATDIGGYGGFSTGIPGYAKGGIAGLSGPELIGVGESEPELIVPLSKVRQAPPSGQSQQVTYIYNINAVDAASFKELVERNPDVISRAAAKGMDTSPYAKAKFGGYGG